METQNYLVPKKALADAGAFSRFYERTYRNVFRYTMALCGGMASEAEDITAETFLRAWNSRAHFTGSEDQALGWVITIARHLLIDRRRWENVRPEEDGLDESTLAGDLDIEEYLVQQEQMQQVLDAIQHLPPPQSEILVLRYVMGWQIKQIAAHLEMPENTISVYLRRATRRLCDQLSVEKE